MDTYNDIFGTDEDDIIYGDQPANIIINHIFASQNLFPDLSERTVILNKDILKGLFDTAELVTPDKQNVLESIAVERDDLTVNYETTATLTFVESGAGFRNTLGYYNVGEDGTISGVDIAFANVKALDKGDSHTFDIPAGSETGLFIIANGFRKNKSFKDMDLENGDLNFYYDFGGENQRLAKITDHAKDVDLVYFKDGISQILRGNVFHTTDKETDPTLNVDGKVHAISGIAGEENPDTLRIGFEDLKYLGDADFNDVVIDLTVETQTVTVAPDNFADLINAGDGNDTVYAGLADDIVNGENGDDEIYGESGNDILNGDSGSDNLFGGSGNDILNGGGENDRLFGQNNNDTLNGNSGNDKLYGGSGSDTLNGGDDNDQLFGEDGDDVISGDSGDDIAEGGGGDDIIRGGNGADSLYGGQGNDTIDGEDGDDTLYGGNNDDVINGGDGVDIIYGDLVEGNESFFGNDTIDAGDGDDFVYAHGGDDIIHGGKGDDNLNGNQGNDIIHGGQGDDIIRGNAENDILNGDDGDDRIYGGGDNDIINGDIGADRLYGEFGEDAISGGDGNDEIYGGGGNDTINGDDGDDTIYGDLTDGTETNVNGNDIIHGGAGNDKIFGHDGQDTLYGDADNDELFGNAGTDILIGGAGNDVLNGGGDSDILIGAEGLDILNGGADSDIFGFTVFDGFSDQIRDFTYGGSTGDHINITDLLSGFEEGVSDINDYVLIDVRNDNFFNLRIDIDGTGTETSFKRVGQVFGSNLTGVSAEDLIANGTLITNESLL